MERATILLCLFGFFKELRPSEPFLTPYLKGPDKNLTEEQVTNEVLPVWTYTYFPTLLVVFLLTDYLRYKPVIVFEGLTLILTWVILVWGQGVALMQVMQVTYGLSTAAEIGYFSYIYSVVPRDRYRKVTGYNRSVVLVGRFAASVIAQALISTKLVGYFALNCFSLGSVCVAFLIGFTLPTAKRSLFFHKDVANPEQLLNTDNVAEKGSLQDSKLCEGQGEDGIAEGRGGALGSTLGGRQESITVTPDKPGSEDTFLCIRDDSTASTDNKRTVQDFQPKAPTTSTALRTRPQREGQFVWLTTLRQLGQSLMDAYRSEALLAWSVWWAFAKCGNSQVGNYVQNLWDMISPSSQHNVYNGAVEAATMLAGALVSLLMGHVKLNWSVIGDAVLGVVSLGMAALLFVMATTDNIWVCYVCYVVYRTSYQALITIATFEVAKNLDKSLYALLFGMNTFVALALQTLLTAVVVDRRVLATPVQAQYTVYGGYFSAIAAAYLLKSVVTCAHRGWRETWRSACVNTTDEDEISEGT
ncbi:SLC19A3 [Branchiostoma lanceolatum]|uniref:SLC19A3 protein n=1 Tax=Branchiostoma lanceolatum TaxID=7740 RepID=A0A8J9ZXD3_BRALA|nr:SLC19A3 [Branchiostoma lanceolatum]CAH1264607.1 SLC19A3 [Branchiostoma lanceolatum]